MSGQARVSLMDAPVSVAGTDIKGVNYGGRFIPEHWLSLPGMSELYAGVTPGTDCQPRPCKLSLCDMAMTAPTGEAAQRMLRYLDRSIQLEHFETMQRMGFDFVRLPLGYWNLVRPMDAPDAPNSTAARWRALELMAAPSDYAPYIARVLRFANSTGLKVLALDLTPTPTFACPDIQNRPRPRRPHPRTHAIIRCCSTCTVHLVGTWVDKKGPGIAGAQKTLVEPHTASGLRAAPVRDAGSAIF